MADGDLTLAFGAIQVPLARDTRGAIHFFELILAGGVADTLGLMLTLIWTAGFLPSFLEGRNISVLLAKPRRAGCCCWANTSACCASCWLNADHLRGRHLAGDRRCAPAFGIRPIC